MTADSSLGGASVAEPSLEPIRDRDALEEPFRAAEKPASQFRVGLEAEKFGVFADGAPIQYEGDRGVVRIFDALVTDHGWRGQRETAGGPIIALLRGDASITLEPGAQLELSGAPHANLAQAHTELSGHLDELGPISRELGITWLATGFHPFATQGDLPWVPKLRYRIMREYLPTRGARAHDMMRRSATVQTNVDFSSEEDAMRKMRVSLALSPIVHAMTANAPFREGRLAGTKSERGAVWLGMDPARSGLVPTLWHAEKPRYRDYVDWALDAGMFLFKRDGDVVENTGQTFREFLDSGFEGHRATMADWKLHLATLFPEARLKSTIELRSIDSLPLSLVCAPSALFVGILYDTSALAEAERLTHDLGLDEIERARPALVSQGLGASIKGKPMRRLAEELLDAALGGLERRGLGEERFLAPLAERALRGETPADSAARGFGPEHLSATAVIARTRADS